MRGSLITVKKDAGALVVANKDIRLEVIADKLRTWSCLEIRMQVKVTNRSFEMVEQFQYLGTTLANQTFIWEEIKSRLKSGNARYPSVKNLLSSSFLSKDTKINVYRTIILHVVLYGCETWSLTLREGSRLSLFENMVLRRIFGPKRDEVTGDWRKLHNEELSDLYSSPNIVRVIKSSRMRWAGYVECMGRREV